jgi:hypothetical protein
MKNIIKDFWIRYDLIDDNSRFIWFLGYVVIPYSVLLSINPLYGLSYAVILIGTRILSTKNKDLNNGE